MSRIDLIGEIAACAGMLALLIGMLILGTAMMPYQPSMGSEQTFTKNFNH